MRLGTFITSIFLCLAAQKLWAQTEKQPLSLSRSDVAKLVIEAPPVYVRQASRFNHHIGLFDKGGKQLRPCRYFNLGNYDTGVALHDNILFLMDTLQNNNSVSDGLYSVGAFSREGLWLYNAFLFDSGPDYFKEGRQRFVYNGRMGFVNRLGEVTVPAQYPFIAPYENAVAYACMDCIYTVVDSLDKEHGTSFVGSEWILIDKRGRELARKKGARGERIDFKEQPPLPAAAETALASVLRKQPIVRGQLMKYGLPDKPWTVACYDEPSKYSPYYHIAFVQDYDGGESDFQFLISPDGHRIFHLSSYSMTPETLAAWKRYMDNAYRY